MAAPKGQGNPKKRPTDSRGGSAVKRQRLPDGAAAAKKGFDPKRKAHKKGDKKPEKLTRHDQKEAAKAKKIATKKNGSLIEEAVVLWEDLRRKETSTEEKAALVTQIMTKVDGRLVELAANHKASRIIQFCAKYGTPQQRTAIMDQVRSNMVQLAKSKYGHHLVRKLVNVSTKEQVPDLVKALRGHIMELLRHPQGADVLTDLYDVAPTHLRNAMCAEFYGREFVLFDGVKQQGSGLTSLKVLLEKEGPAKRRSVMQHMTKALVPIMEKGLLHPPMTHRLLRDFVECAPSMSVEDAVDTLSATGAALLKMVHTHDGAAVMCAALAYGTAKDRKRMIRAMKGHVASMATNEWGFSVLASALTVTDDTSLTGKVICAELKAMIGEAVEDTHAVRVLLQLLCPNNSRYLTPAVLALMQLPQRTVRSSGKRVTDIEGDEDEVTGGDVDDAEDKPNKKKGKAQEGGKKAKHKAPDSEEGEESGEDGEGEEGQLEERVLGVSKKEPMLRRKELLMAGGKPTLGAALLTACAQSAGALLRAPVVCDLVVEAARGGDGALLQEVAPQELSKLHDAIVAEALGEGQQGEGEEAGSGPAPQAEHVFTHYYASRALRRLLLSSGEEKQSAGPATALVEKLWERVCAGRCKDWVGGHGEKVLAAFVHCGSDKVRAAAVKELKLLVSPASVEEWSAKFTGQGHHQHKKQGHSHAAEQTTAVTEAGVKRKPGVGQAGSGAAAQAGKKGKKK